MTTTRESVAEMKRMLVDGRQSDRRRKIRVDHDARNVGYGKHHKADVMIEMGLVVLDAYVADIQVQLVPLSAFGRATKEQFLRSFLKWAETNDGNEDKKEPGKSMVPGFHL